MNSSKNKYKTKHPLFSLWKSMIKRCENPKDIKYSYYGGRGIKVEDSWKDFWTFIKDIGPRPSPFHTIDRINNEAGYSKKNCRWATKKQQAKNRRPLKKCHKGHLWTEETTIWTHNGVGPSRRCKICLLKRLQQTT